MIKNKLILIIGMALAVAIIIMTGIYFAEGKEISTDRLQLLELGMSQEEVVKVIGEPIDVTSDVNLIDQEIYAWRLENTFIISGIIKPDEEKSDREKQLGDMYSESGWLTTQIIDKGLKLDVEMMKYHYVRGGKEKPLLLCFQDSKLILILPEQLQDLP